MKVLTKSANIRSAIRTVLGDPDDTRIIAVAFVGIDALSFLSAPTGLVVYCWPKAGGTNPDGIDLLCDAHVHVHFVQRLHAKIYWSKARGAIIGSANLTTNALGDSGLHEAVVHLSAKQFDINPFLNSLTVIQDFDATLKRLRIEHIRFLQRNPPKSNGRSSENITPAKVFGYWAKGGSTRRDWRLGWYDACVNPPKDSLARYEEISGTRRYADYLAVKRRADLTDGAPTLTFSAKSDQFGRVVVADFRWWYPQVHTVTKLKGWRDCSHVWFAKRLVPLTASVPFDCKEARFRTALANAIDDMGGMQWLEDASRKPSKRFVDHLIRHYETMD